jgi:glutamate synthase domain-containing protein 2
VATGFDLVKNFALGADMCNSARGMMFALGCIQALECNMNTCPTGVATQDKSLMRGLVVDDKKVRVANFHKQTVSSAIQMIGAAGYEKTLRSAPHVYISAY